MEHLPYPASPAVPLPIVPHVCSEPYDRGDFLTYPDRAGYSYFLSDNVELRDRWEGPTDRELEDFLQRWMFFGLLHAFLGDRFKEGDFVRSDLGTLRVCTSSLPKLLQEWAEITKSLGEEERARCTLYQRNCLKATRSALDPLFCRNIGDHRAAVSRVLLASIAGLAESLTHALMMIDEGDAMDWTSIYLTTGHITNVQERTKQHDWCANDASVAVKCLSFVSSMHFFAALSAPDLGRSHADCTETQCRHLQINADEYVPAHAYADCTCELVGPREDEISAALENGSFPVLEIRGNWVTCVHINVVPYAPGVRFVALSHVWADGLGNPRAQKIHACQALRLRDLAESVVGIDPREPQPSVSEVMYIWCDTLCVPPHDSSTDAQHQRWRQQAMHKMRDVYRTAMYVLIVDRTVERYAYATIGVLEAVVRLVTSPWMRRLWTYQEVMLARMPIIVFADQLVSLRNLDKPLARFRKANIAARSTTVTPILFLRWLSMRSLRRGMSENLSTVASALSVRSVSVPSDEPLCICTILDLDMEKITGVAEAQRMEVLWRLISDVPNSIPKGIIFNRLPRMQVSPFQWAPQSLLGSSKAFNYALDDPSGETHSSPSGLIVPFPAWALSKAAEPHGLEREARDLLALDPEALFPTWRILVYEEEQRCWWTMVDSMGGGIDLVFNTPGDVVLIKEYPSSPECNVLFGEVTGGSAACRSVRTIATLYLRKCGHDERHLWNAALERVMSLREADQEPRSVVQAFWDKQRWPTG